MYNLNFVPKDDADTEGREYSRDNFQSNNKTAQFTTKMFSQCPDRESSMRYRVFYYSNKLKESRI